MIRYAFICNQVLQIYKDMSKIVFPIEPKELLTQMENCKVITYLSFAEQNQCTLDMVAKFCNSNSGCTKYDPQSDRYVVLFNSSTENNNVIGRIRWTLAHELGHIVLKHLVNIAEPCIAEHNINNLSDPELEAEADHFAALLLCPMPRFDQLHIRSVPDVQQVFGLSYEASEIRWREYQKLKRSHRKTAGENDMKRVYSQSAANV